MKTTAENRCTGEGKGREKREEASAQLVSQYGVKPGGRRDSCRFSSSLAKCCV
jgi:hypothetical protein